MGSVTLSVAKMTQWLRMDLINAAIAVTFLGLTLFTDFGTCLIGLDSSRQPQWDNSNALMMNRVKEDGGGSLTDKESDADYPEEYFWFRLPMKRRTYGQHRFVSKRMDGASQPYIKRVHGALRFVKPRWGKRADTVMVDDIQDQYYK